jgi:hypothetical protein
MRPNTWAGFDAAHRKRWDLGKRGVASNAFDGGTRLSPCSTQPRKKRIVIVVALFVIDRCRGRISHPSRVIRVEDFACPPRCEVRNLRHVWSLTGKSPGNNSQGIAASSFVQPVDWSHRKKVSPTKSSWCCARRAARCKASSAMLVPGHERIFSDGLSKISGAPPAGRLVIKTSVLGVSFCAAQHAYKWYGSKGDMKLWHLGVCRSTSPALRLLAQKSV